MRWTSEVGRGDWIAARLSGWGTVGGVVPRGFAAYARIFHPLEARLVTSESPLAVETRNAPWREATDAQCAHWHPSMQWAAIAGALDAEVALPGGWTATPPETGWLDPDALAALTHVLSTHTTSPELTAGIWVGWGSFHPGRIVVFVPIGTSQAEAAAANREAQEEHRRSVDEAVARAVDAGPWLRLPDREYLLFESSVHELEDASWPYRAGIGWRDGMPGPIPSLLWPADRSWFVSTEIDYDSTVIGGSRELIDAVLACDVIESAEVDVDTDLTIAGDHLNGQP
jgi:hypothetical protein